MHLASPKFNQGEGRGDNVGKKGKGHQGIYIKDPWTNPKEGRIGGGVCGWVRRGKWWS